MESDKRDELLGKSCKTCRHISRTYRNLLRVKWEYSGSILPGLYDPNVSDMDFVVYGLKNHRNVMEAFAEIKREKWYS